MQSLSRLRRWVLLDRGGRRPRDCDGLGLFGNSAHEAIESPVFGDGLDAGHPGYARGVPRAEQPRPPRQPTWRAPRRVDEVRRPVRDLGRTQEALHVVGEGPPRLLNNVGATYTRRG